MTSFSCSVKAFGMSLSLCDQISKNGHRDYIKISVIVKQNKKSPGLGDKGYWILDEGNSRTKQKSDFFKQVVDLEGFDKIVICTRANGDDFAVRVVQGRDDQNGGVAEGGIRAQHSA